jgi:hypothetical protein
MIPAMFDLRIDLPPVAVRTGDPVMGRCLR